MKRTKLAIGVSLFTLSQSALAYNGTSGDDTHAVSGATLDSQYIMGSGNDTLSFQESLVDGTVSIDMGPGQDSLSFLDVCGASGSTSVSIAAEYSNPLALSVSNTYPCSESYHETHYSIFADTVNLQASNNEGSGTINFSTLTANSLALSGSNEGTIQVGALNIANAISGSAENLNIVLNTDTADIPAGSEFQMGMLVVGNVARIGSNVTASFRGINGGQTEISNGSNLTFRSGANTNILGDYSVGITSPGGINGTISLAEFAAVSLGGNVNGSVSVGDGSSVEVASGNITSGVTAGNDSNIQVGGGVYGDATIGTNSNLSISGTTTGIVESGSGSTVSLGDHYGESATIGEGSTFTANGFSASATTLGDGSTYILNGCFAGQVTLGDNSIFNGESSSCGSNGAITAGNDTHITLGVNATNGRIELGDRSSFVSDRPYTLNYPLTAGNDSRVRLGAGITDTLTAGESADITIGGYIDADTILGAGSTLNAVGSNGDLSLTADAEVNFTNNLTGDLTVKGVNGQGRAEINIANIYGNGVSAQNLSSFILNVSGDIIPSMNLVDVDLIKVTGTNSRGNILAGGTDVSLNFSGDLSGGISVSSSNVSSIIYSSANAPVYTQNGKDYVKQTSSESGSSSRDISLGGGDDVLIVSLSTDDLIDSFNNLGAVFYGGSGTDSLYLNNVSESDSNYASLLALMDTHVRGFENINLSDAPLPAEPVIEEEEEESAGQSGGSESSEENLHAGEGDLLFIMEIPKLNKASSPEESGVDL